MQLSDDLSPFSQKRLDLKSSTLGKKATPVLLVCVYNINGKIISHDIFYRLFCEYGEVLKILIFDKSKVWKTFIELESSDAAENAKQGLNNFVIFDDGSKINVFYSNLMTINFQNSNSGGVDYDAMKKNSSTLNIKEKEQVLPRIINSSQSFTNEGKMENLFFTENSFENKKINKITFAPISKFLSLDSKKAQTWGYGSLNNNIYSATINERDHEENNEEADFDIINLDFIGFDSKSSKNSKINELSKENFEESEKEKKKTFVKEINEKESNTDSLAKLDSVLKNFTMKRKKLSLASTSYESPNQFNLEEKNSLNMIPMLNSNQTSIFSYNFKEEIKNTSGTQDVSQFLTDITDPSTYVNPIFLLENKKSSVLYVRGLNNEIISPLHLF